MQEFTTPMMKQYARIKKKYHDCLLLYRMGDFYELFMEDADIGARVLGITLTSRPKGKDGRIPMSGVPYHAVDSYLSKLVKAGYKVAICEQVSLPNKYGIVDREVVRIVTPGTVLDEKALDKKENNYIVSLALDEEWLALSASDVSTGHFFTMQFPRGNYKQILWDELSRINPSECILPQNLYNNPDILKTLKKIKGLNIYSFLEWENFTGDAKKFLKKHFGVSSLYAFGIEDKPLALQTSSALLGYLQYTQKSTVSHIKKITAFKENEYLSIDRSTILNLELFSTIREHDVKGSLLCVLDETITAMGGRMLKEWIKKPLIKKEEILNRHNAVEEFLEKNEKREKVREEMKNIPDIERIISRLSVGLGNARDLISLKCALKTIFLIKEHIKDSHSDLTQDVFKNMSNKIKEVIEIIDNNIVEDPPYDVKAGGIIKENVNLELDDLQDKVKGSKNWILKLEQEERKKTGISSLKIRFNKIFGFYIEVSKTNLHLVPSSYMRKQTLVNAERFITPKLKIHEEIILTAEEKINSLEYKIFLDVLEKILKYIEVFQKTAFCIAQLDCILNFSYIARKNQYIRPKILYSGELKIKGGRHPVVEKLLEESQFVPNDITLDNINQQLLVITGPNMAGKSVLIRQVALIILMNQIGCFVPAQQAYLSLVDKIFVRSGASDVITSGLSTFMVEMVETAHILHNATKNSLIIMDEIGRGTSTYDGISIAWAVAEYLVTNIKTPPKTLFATHYHELQTLENDYPTHIKNYHMSVEEKDGEPIFLYTFLSGGASHSFGVAVAKLAGIPEEVINRAKELLKNLEQRNIDSRNNFPIPDQPLTTNIVEHLLHKELEKMDVHNMTPLEALNKLAQMKDQLKMMEAEDKKYLEAD